MRFALGIGIGAVVTLAVMEALFRLVPVNSATRMADTDATKPFARFLPRQSYVYSHGWALTNAKRGVTNEQGFTNSPDFARQEGVLVVGDSFIANLMHDYPDTVQGRLDSALGGNVYAASAPGNGLADSLMLTKFYIPSLHPRTVVFFVDAGNLSALTASPSRGHSRFVVESDGAISVVHSEYKESSLKQFIQQSALVRYMYYNLKISDWLSTTVQFGRAPDVGARTDQSALKEKILRYYFSELRSQAVAGPLQVLFLMDGDRKAIYADKASQQPVWTKEDRELFVRLAPIYGHEVVDMQPVFARHWAQHHERMDYLPMDGHWNPVAHKLAADELLKRIEPVLRPAQVD